MFRLIAFVLAFSIALSEQEERRGKIWPFQIVSFPVSCFSFGKLEKDETINSLQNEPCQGTTRNGTCYAQNECSDKGGTSSGSCADGYGVCCICKI